MKAIGLMCASYGYMTTIQRLRGEKKGKPLFSARFVFRTWSQASWLFLAVGSLAIRDSNSLLSKITD